MNSRVEKNTYWNIVQTIIFFGISRNQLHLIGINLYESYIFLCIFVKIVFFLESSNRILLCRRTIFRTLYKMKD